MSSVPVISMDTFYAEARYRVSGDYAVQTSMEHENYDLMLVKDNLDMAVWSADIVYLSETYVVIEVQYVG